MEFKNTQTFRNLANAFAGESQARNRYVFAAGVAKKEGYIQIQTVFQETANNEQEHAKVFFKLLVKHGGGDKIHVDADYPLVYSTTLDHLHAAVAGEHEEWTELYPEFANMAQTEGFPDIADAFRRIASIEQRHEARFQELAHNVEDTTVFKKAEVTSWLCLNCGYVHEGTEAPEECPACQHPQAYFQATE